MPGWPQEKAEFSKVSMIKGGADNWVFYSHSRGELDVLKFKNTSRLNVDPYVSEDKSPNDV